MKVTNNKPIINLQQMEVVPHEENFEYEFPQEKTKDQISWLWKKLAREFPYF
jgi:hypothetical protein